MAKWFSPTDVDNVCARFWISIQTKPTHQSCLIWNFLTHPTLNSLTGPVAVAQSECALLTRQLCTAVSSHAYRASPYSGGLKLKVACPYTK